MDIKKIIGLKVLAIKGIRTDMRKKKNFEPHFILFDDEKTYIEVESQDPYTYHDFNPSAKSFRVMENEFMWKNIMTEEKHFPDADQDIGWWW